ncbi:MAG: GNAT family N-acetyltransferase [Gaiellales bacterium]
MADFVPEDFAPPAGLDGPGFRLEPLGPEHNERDYAAWSGSMDHILATPGFEGWGWPHPMTLEENLGDLRRHRNDYEQRKGFTYTVLEPGTDDVIGCLYIYPLKDGEPGAKVRSWVTERRAELDVPLYTAVSAWLASDWPFSRIDYAPR